MLCVGSNQSVDARIKMSQIEGIDKANERDRHSRSPFLYNEGFVKRLRLKTTSPAGGSKKL